MKWREDRKPTEEPTVSMVAIHAMDEVARDEVFRLVICHVNSFPHGKGFMYSVKVGYSTTSNGSVEIGTDDAAYARAEAAGRARLEELRIELDEEMRKQIR